MRKIRITEPYIGLAEKSSVADAVSFGWGSKSNHYQGLFEHQLKKHTGRKYAIALPSATSGLHLAMRYVYETTEGILPVVTAPELTWIASVAPVEYFKGFNLCFNDINPKTLCMDSLIRKRGQFNPVASIVVDLYGNMPDWDKLLKQARDHNLFVIEDAAQALGSTYKGRPAGSFGDISVFSFHPTKIITTGEGGMLLTDNEDVYNKCRYWADHCRDTTSEKMFWNTGIGYKYKMSCMSAALGVGQMINLPNILKKKQQIHAWYKKYLGKGITLLEPGKGRTSNYWMNTIFWKGNLSRELLMNELDLRGIETRPVFYPLSSMPMFCTQDNPAAYSIRGINLPSGAGLFKEDIQYVCNALKEII